MLPIRRVLGLCQLHRRVALGVSRYVVIREDIELVTSPWPYFTSDSLAVRGIIRLGFGFPHAASIVKIAGALA
ncbi:hypothetical protein A5623_00425 [Mycobacterium colombiense]|uniref:Uncharacterized protein n=1 Tax=Mycobacterium colombiense TaxID=339268 RepID=A0A853M6A4_9MYCO|nr:hypothetical protein A5623_00425 [Mycobacterium colombiense]OBJ64688.1 hypothetical protein A5628_20260 [Mycobacterium colombiense]